MSVQANGSGSSVPLLRRGQRQKLGDLGVQGPFQVYLRAAGLDPAGLLLAAVTDEREQVLSAEHCLLQRGPVTQSQCGTLLRHALEGQNDGFYLTIDLAKLPAQASKVVLALSMGEIGPGDVRSLQTAVQLALGGETKASMIPNASDYSHERSLVLLSFYQKDGVWRVLASGEGFYDGIVGLQRYLALPALVLERVRPPATPPGHNANQGANQGVNQGASQNLNTQSQGIQQGDNQGANQGSNQSNLSQTLAQPMVLPKAWPGGLAPRLPGGLTAAVVFVAVEQEDGSNASGTGFFITPGGHLLTCYHVIEDAQRVSVRAEGEKDFRSALVLAGSEEHDLALLWLPDGNGSVHWLPLASDGNPQLGDELGLLAYPLGSSLGGGITYSQGIINGLRQQEGIPFLQIDTGAAPGSSGGPIFRRNDGWVIGLLHGGVRSSGHNMTINLGVDIRNLTALGWLRQ
jgi:S1-C subfamily serine protease/stress response protein SCP2